MGQSSAIPTRILLVDDDTDTLDLLGELLRSAGYHVDVASGAEEALQKVEAFHPEVAIIDIGLPDLNGYDLARTIRERAGCRLFALSGYSAQSAPDDNAVTSFDAHFVKPVPIASLLDAIRQVPAR
jgi:DNA-binding response OmpR family regulator